jgi:twitching motility protein PilT
VAAKPSLDEKVYSVSETKKVSLRELLSSFKRHGVARMTDLHFKTGKPPTYRVDGELKITSGRPLDGPTMQRIVKALLGEYELVTLKRKRSVNTSHVIEGMRYRVNCFYDRHGLAVAIRALDVRTPQIEWIGFPNGVWEDIVKLGQGLVLVTGTTGVGKSTTIAALIDRIIKTRPCHVITLEDPIEYHFRSDIALVSQRAIGRDVPSYERGLRDCLREDPDVIFVGEMTDQDSATWTLTAAETGHLVFSGIHTRDVAGTITRILDMYPPHRTEEVANQLSLALRYIISQKLLQRADEPGRVAAMEILNNTYGISNLIRQAKPEQIFNVLQTHVRDTPDQRMTTFERSLAKLVCANTISQAEAERSANHPQILADELERQQASA